MRSEAEGRRQQARRDGRLSFKPFGYSRILDEAEAETLYFCLPLSSPREPVNYFSGRTHGMSINKFLDHCTGRGPTVVVCRSGEFKFGGYAGTPWNANKTRFGTPKSFLFSLTRDCKIPYVGRNENSCCLWASPEMVTFGLKDLVLKGDFSVCTSSLEYSYGIGLDPNSPEAAEFLAGSDTFPLDDIECWGFN